MSKSLESYIKHSKGKKLPYSFRIYVGVDRLTGATKHKQMSFKTRNQALKKLVEIKKAVDSGTYQSPVKKQTFKDVVDLWLPRYQETVKPSTYATIKQVIDKHIIPALGRYIVDQIDVMLCQRTVDQWHKDIPNSMRRYFFYARRILDFAVSLELIDSNPMAKVIVPSVPKTSNVAKKVYTIDELQTFLKCAKEYGEPMYYVYFTLLAYTGMRPSEALGVRWSDIDFENGVLHLLRTVDTVEHNQVVIDKPKTKKSIRDIDLDDETIQILRNWRSSMRHQQKIISLDPTDDYVFYNPNRAEHVYVRQQADAWDHKIADEFGIRFISPHGFRHTHASILYDIGEQPKDIQERLGHSTVRTTMDMYTHLSDKRKRESVNHFAQAMQENAGTK